MRELVLDLEVPERIGAGLAYLERGSRLEIELRLETLVDGILATAEVHGTMSAECARCLKPLREDYEGAFTELFPYEPDESLEYVVDDAIVDLEGPLRDAVVLDLPFRPLCRPDCLGLDPETGEARTEPEPEDAEPIDPRWAALAALRDDDAR